MKFLRFLAQNSQPGFGILEEEMVSPVSGDPFSGYTPGRDLIPLTECTILSPCVPGKIVGAGANFYSFVESRGIPVPGQPRLFIKPSTTVADPGQEIFCPDPADIINFEGELGVVIGKKCSRVKKENALEYILGYTCVNDITDISMLEQDGKWDRGKSVDTFLPFGPVISDEINSFDAVIRTVSDGVLKQEMSISDMIFDVPSLIEFISATITLLPGDLIATGSPSGVDRFFPGSMVQIEIEGIGVLKNSMGYGRADRLYSDSGEK